jgi:hypothetical protein
MELADTATPVMAEPLGRGQHVGDVRGRPGPSSQVMGAGAVAALVPGDVIDDHIMRPNAQTMQEIVRRVNGDRNGAAETCSNALCCLVGCCGCATLCCGRLFRTGVGEIDLWLDSSKRPLALEPNQWQWRPNLFQESLGRYNMADEEVFSNAGVALAKIESGSVYFAHQVRTTTGNDTSSAIAIDY